MSWSCFSQVCFAWVKMLFQSYKIFPFDTLIPYKALSPPHHVPHIFFCCHFHNFTVSLQTGDSSQPMFGASLTLVCLSLEICACLVAAWYASAYAIDYVSFGKIINCVHNSFGNSFDHYSWTFFHPVSINLP